MTEASWQTDEWSGKHARGCGKALMPVAGSKVWTALSTYDMIRSFG